MYLTGNYETCNLKHGTNQSLRKTIIYDARVLCTQWAYSHDKGFYHFNVVHQKRNDKKYAVTDLQWGL